MKHLMTNAGGFTLWLGFICAVFASACGDCGRRYNPYGYGHAGLSVNAAGETRCATATQAIESLNASQAQTGNERETAGEGQNAKALWAQIRVIHAQTESYEAEASAHGRVLIAPSGSNSERVELSRFDALPLDEGAEQTLDLSSAAEDQLRVLFSSQRPLELVVEACADAPAYFELAVEFGSADGP